MKKVLSLMLVFLIIFAGCTNSDNDTNQDKNNEENKKNTIIKMACTPPDTLNPLMTNHQSVYDVLFLMYDGLFKVDCDMSAQGVLAENYTSSNENTTYTITLKDNVKFHLGKPFKSEDVIATLDYITFFSNRYNYLKSLIKSYNSVDDKTVVINLNKSVSDFVNLLDFPILPSGLNAEDFSLPNTTFTPNGTSMYKYEYMENRKNMYLNANDDWFYNGEGPKIKRVNVEIMSDEETIIYAFETSMIDILPASFKTAYEYDFSKKGYKTYEIEDNYFTFIGVNTNSQALNNKESRKQLKDIIDKEKIIKNVLNDNAIKSDGPFRENIYFSDKLLHNIKDSESTKTPFINENTSKGENTLVLLYNIDNKTHEKLALFLKHDLESYGYKIELSAQSKSTYLERVLNCHYDIYVGEVNIPNNLDMSFMFCDNLNYGRICAFSSDELTNLCDNLNLMINSESKNISLGNFNKYYEENVFQIPLYFSKSKVFVNNNIKGDLTPDASSLLNGFENLYI